jgi:membrane-associated phospholipid phosphatase
MKRVIQSFILVTLLHSATSAQDSLTTSLQVNTESATATTTTATTPLAAGESPYRTKFCVDAPIIVGGIGLNALGVKLIDQKKNLTMAELATRTPDRVPWFDRSSAGYYSEKADKDSYIPFHASFTMPIIFGLLNKSERHHFGQTMVLYTETMAITGALFTMAAGNIHRSRPYVYGTKADLDKRIDKDSQRSFYAGHTAATAAATFFTAKAFSDHNPDSKAKVYVWIGAAAVPAVVGYLRYKAGMHFLSDNLLGYALGASAGILVPHFHKKKIKNLSVVPQASAGYKGLVAVYKL